VTLMTQFNHAMNQMFVEAESETESLTAVSLKAVNAQEVSGIIVLQCLYEV